MRLSRRHVDSAPPLETENMGETLLTHRIPHDLLSPVFGKGDLSVGKKRIVKRSVLQTAVDGFVFVVRHVRVIAFLCGGVQTVRPKQPCLPLGISALFVFPHEAHR